MKKSIDIQEKTSENGSIKVKGVIWDGLCHCSDESFEVTIQTKSEPNENQIKKFLKETDFRSGDVLQLDRV